jgi:thioredoxin-like negative regulator of GroEL
MKPVVDGLQSEYEGVVEFRIINAETDPDGAALMQQYRVQYVPTFVFLSADGAVVDQIVGEVDESVLVEKLEAL